MLSSKDHQGHTLVELMVASALLLLLLASCTAAFRAALQYHRRIEGQTELEASLMLTIGSITRDTAETAKQAMSWRSTGPQGPALTFPLPRSMQGRLLVDPDNGNRLLFGTVVSYRVMGGDQQLRRYVDPLAAPLAVPPNPLEGLMPPRDAAYYSVAGMEHKVLARGVKLFTLKALVIDNEDSSTSVTPNLALADFLRMELKLERQMDRKYAVSMVLNLVPKN